MRLRLDKLENQSTKMKGFGMFGVRRSKGSPLYNRIFSLFAVVACLFLSGCGVKSNPLTLEEKIFRINEDTKKIKELSKPLKGPLTLHGAITRALQYNYDNRLAQMEAVLQDKYLSIANLEMLPSLAANAGYTSRNNELASESISYKTRKQSLEPSVSQEKDTFTGDLSLSWSVLDLGVSYFQAKQQSDRYLQAHERRRHVVNNIVRDVIYYYWQSMAAEKVFPMLEESLNNAEKAMADLERIEKRRLQPLKTTLEQKKGLLKILVSLKKLKYQLSIAKTRLASLIAVPVTEEYKLIHPKYADKPPCLVTSLKDLEEFGLLFRPDLTEQIYQDRMDRVGVYKEITRMLPGFNLSYGVHYNSNKYHVHDWWNEIAGQVTLNLMELVRGPEYLKAAKTQVQVTEMKRLAMTIAAITQINLGYYQYQQSMDLFKDSNAITIIDERLKEIAGAEKKVKAGSGFNDVSKGAAAIVARLERENNLAETYRSLSNIYFAIGFDIYGDAPLDGDHEKLRNSVEQGLNIMMNGKLPKSLQLPIDEQR